MSEGRNIAHHVFDYTGPGRVQNGAVDLEKPLSDLIRIEMGGAQATVIPTWRVTKNVGKRVRKALGRHFDRYDSAAGHAFEEPANVTDVGRDHRQIAGQRLFNDVRRSLGERGQDKRIRRVQPDRHLVVGVSFAYAKREPRDVAPSQFARLLRELDTFPCGVGATDEHDCQLIERPAEACAGGPAVYLGEDVAID